MPVRSHGASLDILRAFRDHEAWQRQTEENTARLAFASAPVTSSGWGQFSIRKKIDFGCTFIEQPTSHHGYALSDEEDDDAILVEGRFPRALGFVRQWETYVTNGVRYYTGAWVAVIVDTIGPVDTVPSPFNDPGYNLEHTFLFSGIAIKDVMPTIQPPK